MEGKEVRLKLIAQKAKTGKCVSKRNKLYVAKMPKLFKYIILNKYPVKFFNNDF